MNNYNKKNVIILAHILTTVPATDLEEFFIKHKAKRLLFIGHPLLYSKGRPGSHYRLYENGTLVKQKQLPIMPLPSLLQYLLDFFLTLYWVIKTGKKWDLIIALDNLNTCAALLLHTIGRINKVIYYTIDFTPQRFPNKVLNNIYHYIDTLCVKHADLTWNVSPRIMEGRENIRGMKKVDFPNQITVPIGIWFSRINRLNKEKTNKNTLVYAGGLSPHQGIQLVLEAIPEIVKNIHDFQFIIIGMGSYGEELKRQVNELHIEKYVVFRGYMERHQDVEAVLSQCTLAIAMYSKELSKWSYYADPSKIKTYLACGLPIITTSLTHIAPELEKRKCGVVIAYDKTILAKAVITFMQDIEKQRIYSKNAIDFAKEFDWNTVFSRGLKEIVW